MCFCMYECCWHRLHGRSVSLALLLSSTDSSFTVSRGLVWRQPPDWCWRPKCHLPSTAFVPETRHSLQDPCMAPGISDFACALAVVATVPFLEVCVVMCCALLLPNSALGSRLWALWSCSQVTADPWKSLSDLTVLHVFTPWPRAVLEELAGQKQIHIILLFAAIYSRVWLWCFFQSFSICWGGGGMILGDSLGQRSRPRVDIFQKDFTILSYWCRDFKANNCSKCRFSSQKE